MKRIIVTVAVALAAFVAGAQDIKQATDLYNNAATALNTGDKATAIAYFKQAYDMAKALGQEGEEIASNSQSYIPTLVLSIAKDDIKAGEYEKAIAQLQEAIKSGEEFKSEEVVVEAKDLIPQVYMQKGGVMLNNKKFSDAAAAYKRVLEINPSNGMAALRLGMALTGANDIDGAIAAYQTAAANGQEKSANKQISTIFLKKAAASLKAKKFDDAVAAAVSSNEYMENAQAYQIAGQASQLQKKNEDAVKYFEKYLEMKPDAKNAGQIAFTVAALYQQAGNKSKAVEFYQKATTDPTYGAEAARLAASLK